MGILSDRLRPGKLLATFLAGSWRVVLPNLEFSEKELDQVTPLLNGSGAAALGWHRLALTHLREASSAELLHQAFRLHSLQAEMREQKIAQVFRLLRAAGVEAILAKGWVASRMYPDTALRPYGDLDVLVSPHQENVAKTILASMDTNDCWVDLHQQFNELHDRTFDDLFQRSRLVPLNGELIRIMGAEDHLALLCIHFLRHGAWRPIWLCDIAGAVESVPTEFDWRLCLGQQKTTANWIASAVGLAGSLLGANTKQQPLNFETGLPRWLEEYVLKQWARPFAFDQAPMNHPVPMAYLLKHPAGLWEGLRKRWPNAIVATVGANAKFNDLPRLPYQVANCVARMGHALLRAG